MSRRILIFIINIVGLLMVLVGALVGYGGGFLAGGRIVSILSSGLELNYPVPQVMTGTFYMLLGSGCLAYVLKRKSLTAGFIQLSSRLTYSVVMRHYGILALFSFLVGIELLGLLYTLALLYFINS